LNENTDYSKIGERDFIAFEGLSLAEVHVFFFFMNNIATIEHPWLRCHLSMYGPVDRLMHFGNATQMMIDFLSISVEWNVYIPF